MELRTRLILRNDSTANWSANSSVVLAKGEVGIEFLVDGKVKLKIGDGTKSWAELDYFGGVSEDIELALDSLRSDVNSINEVLFPAADGAETLLSRVEALEIDAGLVDQKIDDKLNDFATKITDDGTVNTLKELINYVAAHGSETATIISQLDGLKELVGTESVEQRIDELSSTFLDKVQKTEKALEETLEHQKYEIAYKPAGTLVDYRDEEIRIMCPADTQWALQNSGEGADKSRYYIGFKAYAPDDAISFKEDLGEIISDNTMYYFEGNDFAGIDAYGRKYSIVWLPVASYNESAGTWAYFGANSSKSRYIGWYYTVDWYNADGIKIDTDTIRINLSNESCHNNIEPYYMGQINVNKLVQDAEDSMVLNGGSASAY